MIRLILSYPYPPNTVKNEENDKSIVYHYLFRCNIYPLFIHEYNTFTNP